MKMVIIIMMIMMMTATRAALYDTFTGERLTPEREADVRRLNLIPWCAIEVADCQPNERRRMDYSCNNPRYPPRGATLTPYSRLLPPIFGRNYSARPAQNGEDLPNVRAIRVAIASDGRRSSEHHTQLVTHVGVFLTAEVTSLHDTVNYVVLTRDCCKPGGEQDPRCLPIRVADDDVHLRRSNVRCLNLTAPITYQFLGCAPISLPPSRINTSPPLLDLSVVYGNNEQNMRKGKQGTGGRLQTELVKGKEWPPSGSILCLLNEAQRGETRCHNGANPAMNALVGVNLFGLWFTRNHNQLADALARMNQCWSDEQLFATARDINIAQWQQLVFYELMPSVMGYQFLLQQGVIFNTYGHVDDYDENLEPRLSLEFVLTYRWFHTMQEGRLRFYDNRGNIVDERNIVDFTLRTGALPLNNTIEGVTQGSFRQPAAASDHLVDPDVGERILGRLQFASDVVASDIMKGRVGGLQSYNEYRQFCGLHRAGSFQELRHWMKEEQLAALELSYRHVDDIDLMAGLISEQPMPGAVMGPTLACILAHQMKRWRTSDRFWYENSAHPGAFTEGIVQSSRGYGIRRVGSGGPFLLYNDGGKQAYGPPDEQLYEIRKFLLSRLICDHGEGVNSIQPYAFLLPEPGNEIRKCTEIPAMRIDPWKDNACLKEEKAQKDSQSSQIGKYFNYSLFL